MAKIVATFSEDQRVEHELEADVTTIGRLKDNDLMIPESSVSGHHARILKKQGKYLFEDLSSTNGSYLNGNRVKAAPLDDGDELMLGLVRCVFTNPVIEEPGSLPKPPRPLPTVPKHPAPVSA